MRSSQPTLQATRTIDFAFPLNPVAFRAEFTCLEATAVAHRIDPLKVQGGGMLAMIVGPGLRVQDIDVVSCFGLPAPDVATRSRLLAVFLDDAASRLSALTGTVWSSTLVRAHRDGTLVQGALLPLRSPREDPAPMPPYFSGVPRTYYDIMIHEGHAALKAAPVGGTSLDGWTLAPSSYDWQAFQESDWRAKISHIAKVVGASALPPDVRPHFDELADGTLRVLRDRFSGRELTVVHALSVASVLARVGSLRIHDSDADWLRDAVAPIREGRVRRLSLGKLLKLGARDSVQQPGSLDFLLSTGVLATSLDPYSVDPHDALSLIYQSAGRSGATDSERVAHVATLLLGLSTSSPGRALLLDDLSQTCTDLRGPFLAESSA